MSLQRSMNHRKRSALLSSLGGVVVIAAVIAANGWSLLTSTPDHAPMDPLRRLSAMKHAEGQITDLRNAEAQEALLGLAEASRDLAARTDAVPVRTDGSPIVGNTGSPVPQAESPGTAEPTGLTMRSWTIQPGDTLAGALGRLYVYGQTQRDVLGAFTKLRDPTKLQAGWRVQGRFASAGLMDASSLRSVVIAPPQGEGITIVRTEAGAFSAEEGGVAGSLQRQAVRCVLTGPLGNSLHRCGEGEGLVGLVESVLASRIQPAPAPQPGDELRLVYDKLMDGDHLVRYQRLVAIQLRSPRALGAEADATDATGPAEQGGPAAHRFTAVWFEDDRTSGWFDLSGTSREPLLDLHPVQVGRFTSGFGMRLHPVLHRMKAHQGVDYAAARGTPIGSAGAGVVLTARAAGAAGNLVRVRHDQGYVTEYMHLQRFAGGLSAGQRIRKGQIIGYVGTTGRSTGPHLHFGIKHHGNYLDPLRMPAVPQAGVGTKSRKSFDETRDDALRLLHALDRAGGQRS